MSIACLFSAAAFFAVLSIEHQSSQTFHQPPNASVVAPTPILKTLLLETTYPVAQWHVQMSGRNITPTLSTSYRFEAMIDGDPSQCFIQADSDDPLSTAATALRWHYNDQSGILWGVGSVAGTLSNKVP